MEVDDIISYQDVVAAEKTLGAKFKIRAFHDAVLELSSVPIARCHDADRPLHRRRRQRSLPGYGVSGSLVFRRAIEQLLV
jgi:hypothetical protein